MTAWAKIFLWVSFFIFMFIVALLLGFLTGCVTRPEIKAAFWMNNGLPADLCASELRLKDYGFYRKLNTGKLEFMPFCNPDVKHFVAIIDSDLEKILDKLLPENKDQ